MTRYAVFHLDFDNVRQQRLGEVELDAANMLHIVAAEAPARAALESAVTEINGKPELIVKLPPGPDDPESSLRKEAVPRTAPGFLGAIEDNLKRWHNMALVATAA
jgi:hypothetical protein